ncbi:hypothetical protein TI04_04785 [Achromatium sp. WMS2]|nr:hypothetical protein TI04_04785 [Achromatium sp. WMS2]
MDCRNPEAMDGRTSPQPPIRHSGMDCRNPEAMDGRTSPQPPIRHSGMDCRNPEARDELFVQCPQNWECGRPVRKNN